MTTARTVRTVEKGDWKAVFLRELARVGIVGAACKKAKIGRTTAYKLRDEDADFAAAWDAALDAFVTKLLDGDVRAIELAMQSVDGPQVQKHETTKTSRLIVSPRLEQPRVVDASVSDNSEYVALPPKSDGAVTGDGALPAAEG